MVDSRLRLNPPTLFHCFVYVNAPGIDDGNRIQNIFPEEFDEKEVMLKLIPDFCFPCKIEYTGVQYSTFVLTDMESKFRFGFCRYPPFAKHCLCLVSYLPWFQTFYYALDKISAINKADQTFTGMSRFLKILQEQPLPDPGSKLIFQYNEDDATLQTFRIGIPDTTKLPSIPDNRNLTEYFAKVTPENMVNLFISMLFERRIIITSEKLSVLTAVVHGSVSLLYPMQWQHIYVPILPAHLIDYCCAPMPFLLGVHASMMEKVHSMPLSEVVIFNADANEMCMITEDLEKFPAKVSSRLKRKLRHTDRALDDYVSRQFLNALADLIGGYRTALKFTDTGDGDKIIFDEELFLNSRSGNMKIFLENILNQQSFRQFVAGRLDLLNENYELMDIFEEAIEQRIKDAANETKYSQLKDKMKSGGGALKKGGGVFKKSVEASYSHLRLMASDIEVTEIKKKIKEKVKDGYKGVLGNKQSAGDTLKAPPPRPPRPLSEFYSKSDLAIDTIDTVPGSQCSTTELRRKNTRERNVSHSEGDLSLFTDSQSTLNSQSDSDSSLECYRNAAFMDNFSKDLLCPMISDDEDVTLEETPIPTRNPYEQHPYEQQHLGHSSPVIDASENKNIDFRDKIIPPVGSEDNVTIIKIDENSRDKLQKVPSLTRQKPLESQKPKVPPRPKLSRETSNPNVIKPKVPERPPSLKLKSQSSFNNEGSNTPVLVDTSTSCNESNSTLMDAHPPGVSRLSSDSSFSSDLLDLDQSLFHETMQSLSDDTRSLMSMERQLKCNTGGNYDVCTQSLMSSNQPKTEYNNGISGSYMQNFRDSRAFFERNDHLPNNNYNNGNITTTNNNDNNNNVSRGISFRTGTNISGRNHVSSTSDGRFANLLEDAKNIKYTKR